MMVTEVGLEYGGLYPELGANAAQAASGSCAIRRLELGGAASDRDPSSSVEQVNHLLHCLCFTFDITTDTQKTQIRRSRFLGYIPTPCKRISVSSSHRYVEMVHDPQYIKLR